MDRVVLQLSGIEDEANAVLEKAKEEKTNLYKKYDEDIKKLDKELSTASSKKLAELQKKYDLERDTEEKKLKANCDEKIKLMEDNYNKNRNKYIDDIFNKIINA